MYLQSVCDTIVCFDKGKIMKRFLAMLIFVSSNVSGMVRLHDNNSLNNEEFYPLYSSSSFDNEYFGKVDELNIEDEVIYIDHEIKVDNNIPHNPEKTDSELIFEMSGIDSSIRTNSNSEVDDRYIGYVEAGVKRFEILENYKKQLNPNKQLISEQKELVYHLQNLENDIISQMDDLTNKHREIQNKIASQYMSMDGKVCDDLKQESYKVLTQLVYLKEALRLSVKRIDSRIDSSNRLNKIFENFELDKALKNSKDFEYITNRLGVLNGKIKVNRLNSLEDLVLNGNTAEKISASLICPNLKRLKLIDYKKSEKLRRLMRDILCNANKLEELNFSCNQLNGEDLNRLIQMEDWPSHIKVLNLCNNEINGIPKVLNRFKNLEILNLNDNWGNKNENNFEENQEYFSDIISFINKNGNLPNLKELHISGFKRNSGKKWPLPKQLRVLEIDGESIDCIPENRVDVISGPSCQMYEEKKLKCTIYLKDLTRRNSYIFGY